MKISTIARLSAAPLALSVALASAPAFAQDAVDTAATADDDLIIVTGSRIARRNVETAAPVAVVPNEEFELSGTVNVENVVNTLPQVVPGFTSNSNNPGTGTATLNLRGLGANRTMVLVNGRRWMFYDTGQVVDLNTIPSFLLDSVDVVTGGASAVYGSDALSGVVNFRLRELDGFEVGGQVAATQEADGYSYELHGAFGTEFADGRGNITAFAEYFKREAVFQGDRDFSRVSIGAESFGDDLQSFGSSTPPQGRFNAPGTVTVRNPLDLNGDGDTLDEGEGTISAPLAAGTVADDAFFATPGLARPRTGFDLYNYAPANYLQIPQERFLIGGMADYEWMDGGHEVYGEVAMVNNRVATELAATPVTGTFNISLDAARPFVDDAFFAALQQLDANEAAASALRVANGLSPLSTAELGVVSASVQRRTTETGSRNSLDERNAFRVLAGLRGPVNDYISYDGYYMFARTRNSNIQAGNISRSAFQAGLDGTATPINIYGPDTLTTDMVDQISILAQNSDISSLEVMTGQLSGTFGDFAIGGGAPVGFALGGEWRKVASEFIPDTALSSGDVIGFNAGDATKGDYSVREIFGELAVPMQFGGMRVELTGAGRYSDYSLDAVGSVWTYAGGIEVEPVDGVILRGQYQHAIRAPNVAELFQGQAIGFPGATDPCGNAAYLAANPGADAVCVATGVPQGNLGNAGVVQLNPQIPALFGGNPDLQEETSDSWTAGVVLQPSFVPGLTITADYFDIKIKDAISVAGGSLQGLFDLCYGQVQDATSPACASFVGIRNNDGAITTDAPPLVSNANLSVLGVSGVDLQVVYGTEVPFSLLTDTGASDFNLSFLGTWTENSYYVPVAELNNRVDCAGEFGGQCGEPTPSFKWTARASLTDGPLTTSVRWRHLSAVDDNDDDVLYTDWNGVERISAYDLMDLTFSMEIMENYTVALGVNNVFNTLPGTPQFDEDGIYVINRPNSLLLGDNQEQANTYPGTYDVLGRRFFLSVDAKF